MSILEERTKEVIQELHSKSVSEWKVENIQKIVNTILKEEAVEIGPTPIVYIAMHYGFAVYKQNLKEGIDASIFLNGTTKNIYKKEKVILVKENEDLFWNRYFAAIELGKYIFDFLDNKNYQSDSFYCHQYNIEHNDDILSERFATEILMPTHSFCKQYLVAAEQQIYSLRYRYKYLSYFFQVPEVLIRTRISEIINRED